MISYNLAEENSRGRHTEVQINHDVPRSLAVVDGTTKAEDLTGEHPPDAADGVATLVVGGNGNVDKLGGRVGVAQSNDGDVDVAGLLDGLSIRTRVRHHNQTWLLEGPSDIVGEGTGGESTSDGLGTSVRGELEHSTLTIRTSRDDTNIRRVVDSGDDTSGEHNLLPVDMAGLAKEQL
jgi:hypothetical protein